MALQFTPARPQFAAEAGAVDLREVHDEETLAAIRKAMDDFAVVVFHEQAFTDQEQLDFARRLDGEIHSKTGASALYKTRLATEEIADISNLDHAGSILDRADRKRLYSLANRLWHTDASFQDPPGRYSMLSARVVPPVPADTQYADMRAAYDALSEEMKVRIADLRVHHSIAYSRQTLGFEFSVEEAERLKGAIHPLVNHIPRSERRSLYLASHASRIIDWPLPEARLLIRDLMEHATRPEFVYQHSWREGDLVIWDNRATMHRAMPFDDGGYVRDMRRVTTLDIREPVAA